MLNSIVLSILALSLAVSVSMKSHAASPRTFQIGINTLSHGLNRVSQAPTGERGFLGTNYYNLHFQAHIPINRDRLFSPTLIWMPDFLLPNRSAGDSASTTFLVAGLPLTSNLSRSFDVSVGPALVMYQVKGKGGTTTLSNGNGTSVFALPGETRSSKTIGLLVGAGFNADPVRISFDTMTEGLLSNSKRTFSLMLTLSIHAFDF